MIDLNPTNSIPLATSFVTINEAIHKEALVNSKTKNSQKSILTKFLGEISLPIKFRQLCATSLFSLQKTFINPAWIKNKISPHQSNQATTLIIPQQPLPFSQKQVRNAITSLAIDLCLKIENQNPGQSFSISPVSIIGALGMCLHTIKPEMKGQFLEKLGLAGLSEADAHAGISSVLKEIAIPQEFEKGIIEMTQGVARKPHVEIGDSLIQLAKKTYNADLIVSDNIQNDVNQWVARKTHDKIPDILSDNDAALVLLNVFYLALQWKEKFDKPKEGWNVEPFTCLDGKEALVSMMTQTGDFPIYKGNNFSMLEKSYLSPDGRKLSQLIFLPNDPKDLVAIEKTLTAETIRHYRDGSIRYNVDLKIPKTKTESEFHLLDMLKELGIPLDHLDKNIVKDMFISDIIHKTYISTDEEGTIAAAATAVIFAESAGMSIPETFNVKHSFAYLVMDGDTVLFRGRVSDKNPLIVDS